MNRRGDYGSGEQPTIVQPSSWPVFTGPPALRSRAGIDLMAAILLSLPGNLRFRGLCLVLCYEAETTLVEECCSTLESLEIDVGALVRLLGTSVCVNDLTPILDWPLSVHINPSKATKLKGVTFKFWLYPRWVLVTLRTITHGRTGLERITLIMLFW